MKTKIEVTTNINQCQLKKGEKGYIDGYVQGGDGIPYVAVVVGEKVDLIPTYALKVLKQ